jgi:hypothetical protein
MAFAHFIGERFQSRRREMILLKFAKQLTELPGETGQSGAGAKQFQFAALLFEHRAQHHDAAFFGEQFGNWNAKLIKNKFGEAFEGENVQASVTGQIATGEKLALQLESRLFGREENERRAFRIAVQFFPDFAQAAMRLAAASGAEKKTDLHAAFFPQSGGGAKQLL